MNCVCNNLYNMIQNNLREMVTTYANNRINSGSPSTDDGAYNPNLNLLNRENNNSFDSNLFFNVFFFLLALVTLSSFVNYRRRRRLGGNGSCN